MRVLIAVGGNALLKETQRGTWADQLASAHEVTEAVVALRRDGHQVVLTHGNGPQVGTLMLQHAMGEPQVPALPLHALGAMTQGILGYLLQTSIAEIDPEAQSATILTRVRVDDDDPAFDNRRSRSARSTTRRTRSASRRSAAGWSARTPGAAGAAWSPARSRSRSSSSTRSG